MKEIFNNIKFVFKYNKKSIVFTWLFFFILSLSNDSPHSTFKLVLLTGLFTLVIIVFASISQYLRSNSKRNEKC